MVRAGIVGVCALAVLAACALVIVSWPSDSAPTELDMRIGSMGSLQPVAPSQVAPLNAQGAFIVQTECPPGVSVCGGNPAAGTGAGSGAGGKKKTKKAIKRAERAMKRKLRRADRRIDRKIDRKFKQLAKSMISWKSKVARKIAALESKVRGYTRAARCPGL